MDANMNLPEDVKKMLALLAEGLKTHAARVASCAYIAARVGGQSETEAKVTAAAAYREARNL